MIIILLHNAGAAQGLPTPSGRSNAYIVWAKRGSMSWQNSIRVRVWSNVPVTQDGRSHPACKANTITSKSRTSIVLLYRQEDRCLAYIVSI